MAIEIIYSHVPKTGGVSFRNALLTHYTEEEILPPWNLFNTRPEYKQAIDMWFDYIDLKRQWDAKAKEIDPKVKVIMGHFPMRLFDGIFEDAFRIIWLRNPVNRVISVYHHYKTKGGLVGDHTKQAKLRSQNMTLKEFVDLPQQQNVMSHFYESAQEFDFVGLVGCYHECLDLFCHLVGWDEIIPVHYNKGVYKPATSGMRDYIWEHNKSDIALYRSFINDKDKIT